QPHAFFESQEEVARSFAMLGPAMRTFVALLLPLFVVLAFSFAPRDAFAQTAAQRKEAERHFSVGVKAFDGGDYQTALSEFLETYKIFPEETQLLFNMAQTYRKLGKNEEALVYYEKYIKFDRSGVNAAEARRNIAELKPEIDAAQERRNQEE